MCPTNAKFAKPYAPMQKFCTCLMNNSKNKKYNYNINNNTKTAT